ncbi:hypothetical protein L1987_39782 [Smallanthus sonchifolius]|uniref:Uncharacterized protein n=1 Tax=Smallanthus sonchifolius TaxID=185202 RepID=A0ACB9HNM3_9ASTR|nr:hypothetical protein L1987_39782 [Smallanthus sonchifolius]
MPTSQIEESSLFLERYDGTSVRVEFGDATTVASAGAHAIRQSFPHTYGQRLAHFLRATTKVPGAQIISQHPAMRSSTSLISAIYMKFFRNKFISYKFDFRVGLVFCGRQSPGGHNVVWGLHEALKIHNPISTLLGFLGVTSNTDAAQLAETFAEAKCSTKVVGVPVTLNGDLKNQFVEANVGFDTICKVNSQLVSNVCTDALSAEKVILGEEVAASNLTIFDLTKQICDAVQARAEQDKYHGVILLPEGLIESIPEVYALLQKEGSYKGKKFNAICHFFGYQARGSLPSKFDCDYAYVLGYICYHTLASGLNGYMATVTNLKNPSNKWRCRAAPITAMMSIKHDGRAMTVEKPLVHPATVDLRGKVYEYVFHLMILTKEEGLFRLSYQVFKIMLVRQNARKLLLDDIYRNPGPLQFDGPGADSRVVSLCVEDLDYMGRIKELNEYLDKVRSIVKPGCPQDVVKAALSAMSSVTNILSVMSSASNGSA